MHLRATKFLALLITLAIGARAADQLDQLVDGGHWKRAAAAVDAALQKNPNDAHALRLKARVRMIYGDLEGAEGLAKKAVELDPKSADAHYWLARVYGEQAGKASFFKQIGLARNVRKELDAALAIDPKHGQAHYVYMIYYWDAPGIVGGDKNKARAEAQEVMKIDAVRGYMALAELAEKEKQVDKLPDLYRKQHDANPNNYETAITWCSYLTSKSRWAEAEKCSRDLEKLDPTRSNAYTLLAVVYASQKRWPDLDTTLALAEKNVPDNLVPYYQAGRVIVTDASGSDYARAERYFRKYLTQEPEPGQPKLAAAHWRLGLALEKQGHKADAYKEVEIATKMDPKLEAAQADLKRLR